MVQHRIFQVAAVLTPSPHRPFSLPSLFGIARNNNKRYYFSDPTRKSLKGTIDLSACSDVVSAELCTCPWPGNAEARLSFGLGFKKLKRVYHFFTEDPDKMEGWIRCSPPRPTTIVA